MQLSASLRRHGYVLPFNLVVMNRKLVRMVDRMKCPGGRWDVGVMLTTDAEIRQLNKRYRRKDKPTDILSFPYHNVRLFNPFIWSLI